ncbi:MAG: hypothetical protein J6T47_07340, partial [Lachnospiraceae bacterium]|nr:hypothetical protein [Lachnospiraceae bacterium]
SGKGNISSNSYMYSMIPGPKEDGALYYVVAIDKFGRSTRSNTGQIIVLSQPQDTTAGAGNVATFSVSTNFPERVASYQWQSKKPGSTEWVNSGQSGAKTATLSVATNAGLNGYQFRCIVTHKNGKTATSYAAELTVVPKITKQPTNTKVSAGETAKFTVAASGKEPLSYQWQSRQNSSASWTNSGQSGARTATLSVATNAGLHGWQFRCVITDGNGKKSYSNAATLTIVPKITKQPTDVTTTVGATAKYSITATGKETLKYQWQSRKDASSAWANSGQSGAKTATLSVATNAGLHGWQFRCVVTDANGQKAESEVATLFVKTDTPKITKQPVNASVTAGTTAKFTVTAICTKSLTYQWQSRKNSSATWVNSGQSGAKTATLSVKTNAGLHGYQFRCIVKDASGNQKISNTVTLSIVPKITKQPINASVSRGLKRYLPLRRPEQEH